MAQYYYKCQQGLIVLQTVIDFDTKAISYKTFVIDTKGYEVAQSHCMFCGVHSEFVEEKDAKKHRKLIVDTIRESLLQYKQRKPIVRFNLDDEVFIIEKKPKITRADKEAEWDAFGRMVRKQGLCQEDTIETLLIEARETLLKCF